MNASLYLRTLGHFELVRQDRNAPLSVPVGKSRALLVYLALTPQAVRRERLADLIWPDLPVQTGRFNLRHTLFHLRRLCNPACGTADLLQLDRDHVSLTPGVLEVDASLLLAAGVNAEATLCQGDFMADFHLPGCDEFEEWLLSTQERIRLAQVGMLDVLSSRCEATGDMGAAIAHARQLTAISPYSDEARQRLMCLLAAGGQRQTVMAELECFSSLLMRDLGVYPKEETLRMAEELSIGQPGLAMPAVDRMERRMRPRRERRSATALYCELANSLADDESFDRKAGAERLFAAVVQKHQGTVLNSLRWGMLAYFGFPSACEAAPARAVSAALAASEAFASAGLSVRSGAHLGFMVCDAHVPDVTGEMAEIARRLCLVAEHGEVVVSGELQGAVAGRFATVALGEHRFRGLERPFHVARVTGAVAPWQGEGAPPRLFGREKEVSLLENGLVRVQAGEALCMSIYGAVGMGKSALASVAATMARRLGLHVMKLRCLPDYHDSPYFPFAFYLVERFGLDGSAEDKASQLTQSLAMRGFDSDQGIFAPLFSLAVNESDGAETSSPARRKRLIAGLTELARGLCARQPMLLIVEDMHWADPSSRELLAHLARQVQSRLLILSTSLDAPLSGEGGERERIALAPLDATQSQELVRSVAVDEIDTTRMARIVDLAAGVPFFLTAMARGSCDGAPPSCIQTMLQVRLDHLGAGKRVAQMASVLGCRVEPDSLSVLCGLPVGALDVPLRELVDAAILQWDDDGRLGFQNAILREAVYHSLMAEDRRLAHRRVAQTLSGEAADRALVAHHFDLAREWEQAARWWLDAGEHCVWLHANREALDHFAAGVAAAERMPEGAARNQLLLSLHLRRIVPQVALHGYSSSEACQARLAAKEMGSACSDSFCAFDLVWEEWSYASHQTNHAVALELSQDLARLAKACGEPVLLNHARYAKATSEFRLGRFDAAERRLAQISSPPSLGMQRAAFKRFGDNIWVNATAFLARINWFRGHIARVETLIAEAEERAESFGGRRSQAYVLMLRAEIGYLSRDSAQVAEASRELARIAAEDELATWQAVAAAMGGWARAAEGDMAGVDTMIASTVQVAHAKPYISSIFYLVTAEVFLYSLRLGEAESQLAHARALMDRNGEMYLKAELERICACRCLLDGQGEQALAHAREALAIARQQGARALATRAQFTLQQIIEGAEIGRAEWMKRGCTPLLASALQVNGKVRMMI